VTTRLTVPLSLAVLALAASPPSVHAAPALSSGCFNPANAPVSCSAWQTQPVTVAWAWDQLTAVPLTPGCARTTYSDDTPTLTISCKVRDTQDQSTTEETLDLRIDRTPPEVTGANPGRAADHNGWWNHPVGFLFSGTDATSGIAACDPTTFGGPGTVVVGTCRDNAGNETSRGFPIAFDDTPPTLDAVRTTIGNTSATVTWRGSSDIAQSQVVRSPGTNGAFSSMVYSGPGKSFVDTGMLNGTVYRYTVTAFDQAGNATSGSSSVEPAAWVGLRPAYKAKLTHVPLLHWPPVADARYYNVQVFRGKRKVFTTWPGAAQLRLRHHVNFRGRMLTLRPGFYRWYVWPGLGARRLHRYGPMVGASSFILVSRTSG
jgi:hypothetical protein